MSRVQHSSDLDLTVHIALNLIDIGFFALCDEEQHNAGFAQLIDTFVIRSLADPDHKCKRIYLSPKGKTLTQEKVVSLSKESDLLFLCGSYEGVDQRVLDLCIDEELSIGDYVLTSGDLPCMVTINAISRYLDGVLGSEESTEEESFASGLLEYPQYTRPQEFMGLKVPEVLVGGNHGEVAKWRREKQIEVTRALRPDLLPEDKK